MGMGLGFRISVAVEMLENVKKIPIDIKFKAK